MGLVQTIAIILSIWIALIVLVRLVVIRFLTVGPGSIATNMLWRVARFLARFVHRTSFSGMSHVPNSRNPSPLIVVGNHTGAVDPVLIQAACRFEIRWMMAEEMMGPSLDWMWKRQRLIPVDRFKTDSAPLREAIRHVKAGGVIGIFPEGRIVSPRGEIRPFMDGVGLIVVRTKAPVLLTWISCTPEKLTLAGSVFTRSRSRVEFIGLVDFGEERDAAKVTQMLRRRIAEASGWRINDESMPPLRPAAAPFSA